MSIFNSFCNMVGPALNTTTLTSLCKWPVPGNSKSGQMCQKYIKIVLSKCFLTTEGCSVKVRATIHIFQLDAVINGSKLPISKFLMISLSNQRNLEGTIFSCFLVRLSSAEFLQTSLVRPGQIF